MARRARGGDLPGYDMVIQGESGLMDVTGFPETGPTKVGVAITDCLAALYAVQGILLAHISRARTGQGQFLDIALLDSAVSVLGLPSGIVAATGKSPGRLGNAHPSLAPYEPYPAADGYVIVAVANPRLWSRFCSAVGAEALEHDPRFATNSDRLHNRAELNDAIRLLFRDETVDSLVERLSAAGVPCGRVRTIDEVLARSSARRAPDADRHRSRRRVGQGSREPDQAVGRRDTAGSRAAAARRAHRRDPQRRHRGQAPNAVTMLKNAAVTENSQKLDKKFFGSWKLEVGS